jgi:hypothetical protein
MPGVNPGGGGGGGNAPGGNIPIFGGGIPIGIPTGAPIIGIP